VTESTRLAELREGLDAVRHRIETACEQAGRDQGEVTLVAVTKFFPTSDIELLAELGVTDVGESRDQEAAGKVAELPEQVRTALRVHFVGQLQSNKARSVARYADVVHSLDRAKLVGALDRAAGEATEAGERTAYLQVLVQVDLEQGEADRTGRGGVPPQELSALAERVAATEHLQLRGVMAIAPLGLDDSGTGAALQRLARCSEQVREIEPDARWISAGMSDDLEVAVAAGATHLRVGTAILGSRPTAR
jgi:pyridoxal phosphate enzyme (YggS family)